MKMKWAKYRKQAIPGPLLTGCQHSGHQQVSTYLQAPAEGHTHTRVQSPRGEPAILPASISTGKSTGISTWFMFGVEPTIAHPNGYLETANP